MGCSENGVHCSNNGICDHVIMLYINNGKLWLINGSIGFIYTYCNGLSTTWCHLQAGASPVM